MEKHMTEPLLRVNAEGRPSRPRVPLPLRIVVEYLGTLIFVLFGAGTAAHLGSTDSGGPSISAAAAHGLITMVLIYLFADISGAHFNAGPTITDMVIQKMPVLHGALY